MKILMLDNELPPLGGGMGTANLALLKQLANRPDITIDVITSGLGGNYQFESFSERIHIYKVPVWNQNIHHSSNRELIFYFIQAIFQGIFLQLKNHYDFCFAWSVLPAGAAALAIYYIFRLPYMVWVSGPDIPGFEQRYEKLYPLLFPMTRCVWRNAHPVIAKCNEEAQMIHALDKQANLEIIPNGADIISVIRPPHHDETKPLEVICVARLIERKGQVHLIHAVRKLKDGGTRIIVNLAGTGDSHQDYQTLCQELGVQDCVNFLGYIPRENLQQYYFSADVFVLPSFNEGMSLAALEGMAAGLPVLLTKTGGTDLLVEDGVNGFTFNYGDSDHLAELLEQLDKNRALVQKMGEASHLRVEQFSWSRIVDQFLQLFNRIMAK